MTELLDPPAERDLPARRAAEIRARLLTEARTVPGPALRRRRVAVALIATAMIATVGVVTWPHPERGAVVLAFGPDELSPTLRQSAERCLALGDERARASATVADLAVAVEHGDHAALMFLADGHYVACDLWGPPHQSWSGGTATSVDDPTWREAWLPGPVQRLLLTSTDPDGGEVVAIGRVSDRVHRLVLQQADGTITPARIANGAFGLVGEGISEDGGAALVASDRAGVEIDRRPLFTPFDQLGRCYVDPAGVVVYGDPGPACQPAEPWRQR
ncbi:MULTISPECIES: hypothetical protein [unclassified Micromonospora]|uniref:hypothetical protein n=1 Tax=unclassified Micromonospora TaxID=2617518 RepID=UPI0022B6EF9B|nr:MULTISPECIES: hypothetical protein [unclassified Micromonospora]MCZ7418255.1 hypothetical protein [Verrucosispora sp. WMMA2121]WBB91988.1 hypothetical protein O7597_02845 [Verrucosispora sp. WMMC514]